MSGYVAMRWLKVSALPTPERLERIVALAEEVDWNHGAPSSARVEPKEIADAYRRFLAGAQERPMVTLAAHKDDLARKLCADGARYYLRCSQPVVGVRKGDLYFGHPDVLSSNRKDTPGFLEFHFPATFSPRPQDKILATDDLPNRRLYETIKAEIMKGSKPLVLIGPTREWRLPVRVDPELRDWIAAHPVFTGNGLRLK